MNLKYLSITLAIVLLTGCDGGSSSTSKQNDGEGSIDLAEYFPLESMSKIFLTTKKDGELSERGHYIHNIEVNNKTITFRDVKDTKVVQTVRISDTNITIENKENNFTYYRHADIGDTLFSDTFKEVKTVEVGKTILNTKTICKLVSKVEQFEEDDNKYVEDILKIECIEKGTFITEVKESLVDYIRDDVNGSHSIYDKSYKYIKKGLGVVALVNSDCLTDKQLPFVNDNAKECARTNYNKEFYLP